MNKKPMITKSTVRVNKRRKSKLATLVHYFFEMKWAIGTNVAAAMAISTSTL